MLTFQHLLGADRDGRIDGFPRTITVGGQQKTNLSKMRYTDDIGIIAESKDQLAGLS